MTIDHPHQWFGGRTYAQHGDDLMLLNIFKRLRIELPCYLDIGAHHPFDLSNTALFYARGSRGINVEANPDLIEAFHKHRPQDKNVSVAVGKRPGVARFHRLDEASSGLNSLLPIKGHSLMDIIDVPVMTADEIVDIHAGGCWPDLLNVDAEGVDFDILSSIHYSKGHPKVVCAEAVSPAGDISGNLRELMGGNGYIVHSWAGSNMIFVRAELRDWLY